MSARWSRFAWGVLAYNILVIVWGAFVRATGSGAGCGSHWPTCHGTIVPPEASMQTLIELTHRATSGLALVAVVSLLVITLKQTRAGHPARTSAVWSLVFVVLEAGIGAGIVLFEWVAGDRSLARGWVMSAHLCNTFLLLAALTCTAWHLGGGPRFAYFPWRGRFSLLFFAAAVGVFLTGASGGIAALGNTLFPALSLSHGLAQDLSPTSHLFLRLRALHPLFAVATSILLFFVQRSAREAWPETARITYVLLGLVVVQVGVGVVNLLLHAPTALQLVHLTIADLVWIAFVLVVAESRRAASTSG